MIIWLVVNSHLVAYYLITIISFSKEVSSHAPKLLCCKDIAL